MGEDRELWFDAVPLSEEQITDLAACREAYKVLYRELKIRIPAGRRASIVWTHLEEAAMMTTKAISHG